MLSNGQPPNYLKDSFNEKGERVSPKLSADLKNFIIDIDGVICEDIPNEEPERMAAAGEIAGAKKMIKRWYDEGHIITFFTSLTEDLRPVTKAWIEGHGFKYHNLICGKPRGGNYHYIDDRKIRATKFKGKFSELVCRYKKIQIFK